MRIVVMADSHGDGDALERLLRRHMHDTDMFIHLGDGVKEFRALSRFFPGKACYCVMGNNEASLIE